MTKKPYHVYAPDGFESAHHTFGAAQRAARRGAKRRAMTYRIVQCDVYGFTGGGHGTLLKTVSPCTR